MDRDLPSRGWSGTGLNGRRVCPKEWIEFKGYAHFQCARNVGSDSTSKSAGSRLEGDANEFRLDFSQGRVRKCTQISCINHLFAHARAISQLSTILGETIPKYQYR